VSDGKWHKGPPPSVGWWPASANRIESLICFWDGAQWSAACSPSMTAEYAAHRAATKHPHSKYVAWRHRPDNWPEWSKT
jgi:hypothetical protein